MALLSGSTYPPGTLRWHHIISGAAASAAVSAGENPEIILQKEYNDELFDLYGIRTHWFPIMYDANSDLIWGEDSDKTWTSATSGLDLLYEIGEEDDAWGQFGTIPQEMMIARARIKDFQEMVYYNTQTSAMTTGWLPRVGDVLVIIYDPPLTYEVVDVDPDRMTLGTFTYFNWKLVLRRWQYAREDVPAMPHDYLPSASGCTEASAAETESNTIVDYDDDASLDDDIYGKY